MRPADRDALVLALADVDPTDSAARGRLGGVFRHPRRHRPDRLRASLGSGGVGSPGLSLTPWPPSPGTARRGSASTWPAGSGLGLPWPDGQANELPAGTRTLWVQGDRNFAEMLQAARRLRPARGGGRAGLVARRPHRRLDLDDPETLDALAERIEAAAAGPRGHRHRRDGHGPEPLPARGRQGVLRPADGPGRPTGCAFFGLTHLSKDKEALGRRIVEKARVRRQDDQARPRGAAEPHAGSGSTRRPDVAPAPRGHDGGRGNDYDFTPPSPRPSPNRGGRPARRASEGRKFIRDARSSRTI